jgi:hypothetical protein
MPRPNPPRKRPRRRPDSVERAARAEVSLAKQTAQVKENGGKPQTGKQQPAPKSRTVGKGGAAPRGRIDEPFVPWAKRSYLILVALLATAEVAVGSLAFFTLANPKPEFGLYVLGVSYNPLVPVAAALVAAPIAKLITKESRALRFMESVMSGILQYFIWLAMFVALTYLIGGFASSKSSASTIATPTAVVGLLVIDILSFVATYFAYPPLYKFMRRRPPPRQPRAAKPKPAEARSGSRSNVDRMDEAAARDPQQKDPAS